MTQIKNGIFEEVYQIVKKIPLGKVMTYGQVATELKIQNSKLKVNGRIVGFALHANRNLQVPCHRVVNKEGRLAPGFAFDGPKEQRRRLEAEGVEFLDENHVNLNRVQNHGHF